MNRFYADLKEDCHGNLTGPLKLPADGLFTLECLAEIVRQVADANALSAREVMTDLNSVVMGKVT